MDQLGILLTQHREIRKLFREASKARSASERFTALEAARSEIELHTFLEEACVYPVLEDYDSIKREVYGFWREHDRIAQDLEATLSFHQDELVFREKLQSLIAIFEEHVREEELHIYAEARKLLGADQLKAMEQNMRSMILERRLAA